MKMNMKECGDLYAERYGCTKVEGERVMRSAIDTLKEALLTNGGVSFLGLFSLEVVERKEKNGINPQTKERHVIPAHKAVKFTLGKNLKEELNK